MENDIDIQQHLLQLLRDHPKLDITHMEVHVDNRMVTLKGRADTEEERILAETLAKACPGVKSVKNELHLGAGIIHTITSLVSGLSATNENELHKKDKEPGS